MAEDNNTIDQLTKAQIECLLLVHQHLTSKEIAPRLGISPHTVDQRIRAALRILGCKGRSQAAKLVASSRRHEEVFLLQREVTEAFVDHQAKPLKSKSSNSIPLPFTTLDHPTNEMSVLFRLFWIVAIAAGRRSLQGCIWPAWRVSRDSFKRKNPMAGVSLPRSRRATGQTW